MTRTRTITFNCPHTISSYNVEFKHGILQDKQNELAAYLATLSSRIAIITDEKVAPNHGIKLQNALNKHGLETLLLTFPGGEQNKNRQTKEYLENQLFEKGFSKDTCLVALGGGVVTDMGGYIAATYCRGIPLVHIPTSLLGMVDASLGGKNGINVPYGKNLIGAVYYPKKIIIDSNTLLSLPLKELRNGIVEMIKHGIIYDADYFSFLENNAENILQLNLDIIERAIYDSCIIKKDIVEMDANENCIRNLLNFRHTVGHAIEQLSNYSLAHGEAVAIGILVESFISQELGYLKQNSFDKIYQIMRKYSLPLSIPERFSFEKLLSLMKVDKKSLKGTPRIVIIEEIGSAVKFDGAYCTNIPETLLNKSLEWMYNDLCFDKRS